MKWLNGWSAAATFEGEFSNVTAQLRRQGRGALCVVKDADGAASAVIACDKREAFAQGSASDEASNTIPAP